MTQSVPVRSPCTLADAVAAWAEAGPGARLLAGGTDLMVELHAGRAQPERVVDLWGVPELRGVARDGDGLRLGALTTASDLLAEPLVAQHFPALLACAGDFAAPQIRNRATLGGNLATASPASDLAPVLLALGAGVRLLGPGGARELPVARFLVGYRRHAGRPDELIESVWLPLPAPGTRQAFRKVGPRAAQAIAKVAVAVTARVEDGRVAALSAAAGAVAPQAVLLPSLQALVDTVPGVAAIADAARTAATRDCAPIDDVRSTGRYRRHVLQRVLQGELERMLLEA